MIRLSYFNFNLLRSLFFSDSLNVQLSLRENPLIVRFVQEISLNPPTLLELSARVIRTSGILYGPHDLPKSMRDYLSTAHCCVNPKCKGTCTPNTLCALEDPLVLFFFKLLFIMSEFFFFCLLSLLAIDIGVFFDNRIEHIKFVDFCGKYRVPLLQYLCSSK